MVKNKSKLEVLCEQYMGVMYALLLDDNPEAMRHLDTMRVGLHMTIQGLLQLSFGKRTELNSILHSLDIHIGFPVNEYIPDIGKLKRRETKKYGRLLAEFLLEKFAKSKEEK